MKKIDATSVLAELVKKGTKEVQHNDGWQKGSHLKNNGMVLPYAAISGEALKVTKSRRDYWEALLKSRPKLEDKIVD